jgi:hypothetical protein
MEEATFRVPTCFISEIYLRRYGQKSQLFVDFIQMAYWQGTQKNASFKNKRAVRGFYSNGVCHKKHDNMKSSNFWMARKLCKHNFGSRQWHMPFWHSHGSPDVEFMPWHMPRHEFHIWRSVVPIFKKWHEVKRRIPVTNGTY